MKATAEAMILCPDLFLLGGALRIGHALGAAQPADRLGTFTDDEDVDLYYRVRAAIPF